MTRKVVITDGSSGLGLAAPCEVMAPVYVPRMTPQLMLRAVTFVAGLLFAPMQRAMVRGNPRPMRRGLDMLGGAAVRGVHREPQRIGDMKATSFCARSLRDNSVILYAHGGGFVAGSTRSHARTCALLAAATRREVLAFDYRLAPEHRYPAALDDALVAYEHVLDRVGSAHRIILAGDSAGGALILDLMLLLRELGLPLPRCAIANCPWFDFESRGASLHTARDPMLSPELVEAFAGLTFGDSTARRYHSLAYRDFAGLPPVYLLIGGADPLHDEDMQLARCLRLDGNGGRVEVWQEMPHVWQALDPFLREAGAVSTRVAEFIDAV